MGLDPCSPSDSDQKIGVQVVVPITATKTSFSRGVAAFVVCVLSSAIYLPPTLDHRLKPCIFVRDSPHPNFCKNGWRRPAQVQRWRLRQRCRLAAMSELPEAGQGKLLLLTRLLQAQLGM